MKTQGRVLVVDDDDDLLVMLSTYIASLGFRVETAADGDEALKKYRKGKYDLIISDVIMPNRTGLELLEAVYPKDDEIIFIMISGYPDINRAIEAMRAGAYDYVIKPFELDDLKMRIMRALERKVLRQQLRYSRGFAWALLFSVPVWLVLGIALSLLVRH